MCVFSIPLCHTGAWSVRSQTDGNAEWAHCVSKLFIMWVSPDFLISDTGILLFSSPYLCSNSLVKSSQLSLPWRLFLRTLSSELKSRVTATNSTFPAWFHNLSLYTTLIFLPSGKGCSLGSVFSIENQFFSLPFPVYTNSTHSSILPFPRSFSFVTANRGFLIFLDKNVPVSFS